MRVHSILIWLFAIQTFTVQLAQASNSDPKTTLSASASTSPIPTSSTDPIDQLIEQLQMLNQAVSNLNTTIRDEAQVIADRWNQSNVEFKEGTQMVDKRLAPMSLLQIGFYIGLPVAVIEAVALPVMYCLMNRAIRYQKIINEPV